MTLPLVIREDTAGFRKFKTYWQGHMVDAAIFKGHFYRLAAKFSEQRRCVGYQDAIQRAQTHQVLITVQGQEQSPIYAVWIDQWYESGVTDNPDQSDRPSP